MFGGEIVDGLFIVDCDFVGCCERGWSWFFFFVFFGSLCFWLWCILDFWWYVFVVGSLYLYCIVLCGVIGLEVFVRGGFCGCVCGSLEWLSEWIGFGWIIVKIGLMYKG